MHTLVDANVEPFIELGVRRIGLERRAEARHLGDRG